MQEIVRAGQNFSRREITDADARGRAGARAVQARADRPQGRRVGDTEGADVEVGGAQLTMYDNLDARTGDRGLDRPLPRPAPAAHQHHPGVQPHPQSRPPTGGATRRTRSCSASTAPRGRARTRTRPTSSSSPRPSGATTAGSGAELDLFSFPDEIGSGLAVFHPKGGVIKREMEDYVRRRHIEEGFDYVGTPHITKAHVFELSGHLPYYADTMFPPMELDNAEYYLKAMNCPMHNLIFRSRGRSYRELPLRFFEFGTVYRYEKSGVVHGLTRVRGLTQDDSHSYVTPEQAPGEIRHLLAFVLGLLRDFGLDDYYLELSTRGDDPDKQDKFIGSDEQWAVATDGARGGGAARPASSWCPTRAARRSTARRSPCRPATPSAAPGRCRPSSTTSTSRPASASSTRPPTARTSSR